MPVLKARLGPEQSAIDRIHPDLVQSGPWDFALHPEQRSRRLNEKSQNWALFRKDEW